MTSQVGRLDLNTVPLQWVHAAPAGLSGIGSQISVLPEQFP